MRKLIFLLLFAPIIVFSQEYDQKLLDMLSTNELTAAEKQLEKVYGHDKTTIEYVFLNGKLSRKKGNYTFARECFLNVLAMDSLYANAYNELGVLEIISNEDFKASINYLNRALALKPNDPDILTNRGAVYYLENKIDLAIRDYKAALEADSLNNYAIYNLGLCYYTIDLYELAIEQFNLAQKFQKDDPKIYYDRGKSYYYLGKLKEAKADFKMALKYSDTENRYELIPREDIEYWILMCN